MFSLVAPPTALTWGAWLGLAGLAFALDAPLRSTRGTTFEGGARGLAFGFAVNLVFLRFVPHVIERFTPLPFVAGVLALALLAAAQGVTWAVAGIVRGALVRRRVAPPLAFALATYAAAFVPELFPWLPAETIARAPAMGQLAEHIGARGVGALMALSAGLFAFGVRAVRPGGTSASRRHGVGALALALAIPGATGLHGIARMRAIDARRAQAPAVAIGLVNARVPAATRWDPAAAPEIYSMLARLTRTAETNGAEITVWPESAYPYVLARGARASSLAGDRLPPLGARQPLLAGAVTRDAQGDRYNAAIAVRPDGVFSAEYDKIHLLWFGEAVPFAAAFPWLRRTFARGLGLVPGDRPVAMSLGRVRAAALICFEDTLPEAGREAASVAPNLLVNLTNDAWFAGSSEPEMHLWLAQMRAVETRRDMVRAVNGGPASFIDAAGRIRDAYETVIPGSLVVRAALLDGAPTIYARFGDWPWIIAALSAAIAFARGRTPRARATRPATK